jgi:uncharacterized protein
MKYLIDIGHPAHVHYFRHFANEMIAKGWEVLFTCRDKEMTISLLTHYNLNYVCFGKPFKSLLGKIFGLFYFTLRVLLIAIKFKPDILINASMYSAITAWILRKPHISLEDTFNNEQVRLYLPFTDCVLTGDYEHPSLGKKEVSYSGYQELLYLHPNRFSPDKSILQELGVTSDEKYVILRFVSWNASHDIGHNGISYENKFKAVKEFLKIAKVFISSESELPAELKKYQIKIAPHRMHDAMAFASLIFGESATMVSEGAVLGIPGIYLDDTGRFYTNDQQEKYGLVFNYTESEEDQQKAIEKGVELLTTPGIKEEWQEKRVKMLLEKIDVTAFLVWFIENWPESFRIIEENPDYQFKFR